MKIENIRRWHWAVMGLVAGVALGQATRLSGDRDLLSAYDVVGDQKRFENMLLDHDGDTPRFRDLVVHPISPDRSGSALRSDTQHPVRPGSPQAAPSTPASYVVTGRYFDGPKDTVGRMLCFEAAAPYPPGPALARVSQFGGVDLAARYKAIARPTINDYLSLLGEVAAIDYQFAWWEIGWINALLWAAGGLVLIGGIWPTVINVLVYHRWTRPKEAKRLSLRNITSQKPLATVPTPRDDAQTLAILEQTVLSGLEASSSQDLTEAPGEPAGPPPLRALGATPLEPVALIEREEPHFAIKSGDFYPTEHHELSASDQKRDKSRPE